MIQFSRFCLHMTHQSIKLIPLFHKLSVVKILPNAALQEKKATLGGILDLQIIFHGKWIELEPPTSRPLLLFGFQHIMSSPLTITEDEYIKSINQSKESSSQSCTDLEKWRSQCFTPLLNCNKSAMEESLSQLVKNNSGNASFRGESPHKSYQNFTLELSPTSKWVNRKDVDHRGRKQMSDTSPPAPKKTAPILSLNDPPP